MPFDLPDGPTIDLFSRPLAHARRSRLRGSAYRVRLAMAETLCGALDELASRYARDAATLGLPTAGIFGRKFGGSSGTCDLSPSLASRLQASRGLSGSPEFEVAWKSSAMTLGPPVYVLLPRARRTNGSGFSGWPTPDTNPEAPNTGSNRKAFKNTLDLLVPGRLASWPTPKVATGEYQTDAHGNKILNLQGAAQLAAWPTPQSHDTTTRGNTEADHHHSAHDLSNAAQLAPWPTPCQQDGPKGGPNQGTDRLPGAAALASGATPAASDEKSPSANHGWAKRREGTGMRLNDQVVWRGPISTFSPAPTGKRGVLNPAHSRWLMSYPVAWCQAAIRAHRKLKRPAKRDS
ncbi:MAG: hypothetical protein KGL39_07655 [Patescibacteria group bacterium]|nr:hypothetical protein [Patescibacteria group bacterium]